MIDAFVADLPVLGIADGIRLGGHERVGERLDHRAQQIGTRRGEVVLGEGVQGRQGAPSSVGEPGFWIAFSARGHGGAPKPRS